MSYSFDNNTYDDRPWYRQGWPWFIVSFPAIAVILGFHLLYLAHQTNNSLVVDDYYKQGKSLSQYAARDQLAARLRLSAEIRSADNNIHVSLSQSPDAPLPLVYPESLSLRWVHVTQASRDGGVQLRHFGGGSYFSAAAVLPATGLWRLHVAATDESTTASTDAWRLVSDRVSFEAGASVIAAYRQ